MNSQKFFVLGVGALVGVGLIIAGVNQMQRSSQQPVVTPSPTPGVDSSLFPEQQQAPASAMTNPSPATSTRKTYSSFPGVLLPEDLKNKKVVIETAKGMIEFEIYPEATKAASNFIRLSQDKFYDGLTFHRVEKGFVIQGGDPLGNGTGGPGYKFEDEPVTRSYDKGIVAMANSGPNTNGSQFFIMLDNHPTLPPKYTIFGKVIKGQSVVDSITVGDVMKKVSIQPLK